MNKVRNSNIELMRILAILLVISHHMVVNTPLEGLFDINYHKDNFIYLKIFSLWGKTAINAFIFITGYFMCTAKVTWKKVLKLWMEVKFYIIGFYILFCIIGYIDFSLSELFKTVFNVIYYFNNGFTPSFIVLYLFIPFLNMFLKSLKKEHHLKLIICLLLVFTISVSVFHNRTAFDYIGWYMTVYIVAAYIRLYDMKWTSNNLLCGPILLLLIVGICVFTMICINTGHDFYYYFICESNTICSFLIGMFLFLFFKNLKIKNSRIINFVASTTFGVLLIHTAGDAMRQFIWLDVFNVTALYDYGIGKTIGYSILYSIIVFVVCSLIDAIRILIIEKPVMKLLSKMEWINKEII